MKTWCYWQDMFADMLSALNHSLPRHDASEFSVWDFLDKKDRSVISTKYYSEANTACEHFIANGKWDSHIPTEVVCAILERIRIAYDFCLQLYLWQVHELMS